MNLSHITEQGLVKLVFLILLPLCWFLGDQTENCLASLFSAKIKTLAALGHGKGLGNMCILELEA